jgi:hypothetical protein
MRIAGTLGHIATDMMTELRIEALAYELTGQNEWRDHGAGLRGRKSMIGRIEQKDPNESSELTGMIEASEPTEQITIVQSTRVVMF